MKIDLDISKQEDNSFIISHEKKVIGKLYLDPEYRQLSHLFKVSPQLLQFTEMLRDTLEKGMMISDQIDNLLKPLEDGEIDPLI